MNMSSDSYSVTYQNDAQHSYIVFKLKPEDKIMDYQIRIIKDNPVQNLLALHKNQFNEEISIYYDITSKITLEQFLSRRKLRKHEFLTMVNSFSRGLQAGKRYLLFGGRYILDFKYIYINPLSLEVSLAYMPIKLQADIKEELRAFLIELIVYKAAFVNAEEGNFVYRLLNLLKSEEFSLERLDKLTYDIAVEEAGTKDGSIEESQRNESVKTEIHKTVFKNEKQKPEAKSDNKTVLYSNKLYLNILIQVLFIALGLLTMRILLKQNQGTDAYSIAGVILLILSADFLVVRKLGMLNKSEKKGVNNEEIVKSTRASSNNERKNRRTEKQQAKYQIAEKSMRLNDFIDMETSILSDQPASCAYLVSFRDSGNEKIAIDKASFIIGRLRGQVDYVSSSNAVGKIHAEIVSRDGIYCIKDLNSRNGTYINGERIISNVEYFIKNDDRVAFANCEYQFLCSGGAN